MYMAFRYEHPSIPLQQFVNDLYQHSETSETSHLFIPTVQTLLFPHSPPLSHWISTACRYEKQWNEHRGVPKGPRILGDPDAVLFSVLETLWRDTLQEKVWTDVSAAPTSDYAMSCETPAPSTAKQLADSTNLNQASGDTPRLLDTQERKGVQFFFPRLDEV